MYRIAEIAAWGSVVGSALQFAIQLPAVLVVAQRLRLSLDTASAHVRAVIRNFGPALVSRGVVQVSSYVDAMLASLLPSGALAALSYAQISTRYPSASSALRCRPPSCRQWPAPRGIGRW